MKYLLSWVGLILLSAPSGLASDLQATRILQCVESGALGTQASFDVYLDVNGHYLVSDASGLWNASMDVTSRTLHWENEWLTFGSDLKNSRKRESLSDIGLPISCKE